MTLTASLIISSALFLLHFRCLCTFSSLSRVCFILSLLELISSLTSLIGGKSSNEVISEISNQKLECDEISLSFSFASRAFATICSVIGLLSSVAANSNDITLTSALGESLINETAKQHAEKYFRNLLKKATHGGESLEDHNFKIIQTEHELKTAFCNLYNRNNDTDAMLDKRDKRLISEMRKLNMKLMKIEDKLVEIEKNVEEVIKLQMVAIKDELIMSVRNILVDKN